MRFHYNAWLATGAFGIVELSALDSMDEASRNFREVRVFLNHSLFSSFLLSSGPVMIVNVPHRKSFSNNSWRSLGFLRASHFARRNLRSFSIIIVRAFSASASDVWALDQRPSIDRSDAMFCRSLVHIQSTSRWHSDSDPNVRLNFFSRLVHTKCSKCSRRFSSGSLPSWG